MSRWTSGCSAPGSKPVTGKKTVLTPIHEGFNFLGHTLRKYEDKLLITPAKGKIQILRDKIRRLMQAALALTQEVPTTP